MTWRTQTGDRIVTGAEAAVIRALIGQIVPYLDYYISYDSAEDDWPYYVGPLRRLGPRSQLALLAEVGHGLLRETTECPKLNANTESAIASVFGNVVVEIAYEMDNLPEGEPPYWRQLVSDALRETGDSAPPNPGSFERDEWRLAVQLWKGLSRMCRR